jgi:formate-dependent nitrite reductase cytochrome c552 subunit
MRTATHRPHTERALRPCDARIKVSAREHQVIDVCRECHYFFA